MRSNGAVRLLIICENTTGKTKIKISNTSGVVGPLLCDLGVWSNFIRQVETIFKPYAILNEEYV